MVDLKELKANANVPAIIGNRIELKAEGSGFQACCPFHNEKSPSFKLNDKGKDGWLWHCFGCGKGGDVITFLEMFDHIDSKTAINRLAEAAGTNVNFHQQAKKVTDTFKPLSSESKEKSKVTIPMEKWLVKEKALEDCAAAQKWLQDVRGINYETAKLMHLGYTQEHPFAVKEGFEACKKQGWIIFPRVVNGVIVALKYRSITEKVFSQMPNMSTRTLFNIETITPLEPIFVTEGEFDACVFEQANFRAVSLPSAGAELNPEDKKALKLAECVYLAGDTDAAGKQSMLKLQRELTDGKSRNVHLLVWPEGVKDANDYWRDVTNRDTTAFYQGIQKLMSEARNRPPENVQALIKMMRQSQGNDLQNDPERLQFPPELGDVDRMTYTPKGGVAIIYSTYSGTGKSMFKTQLLLYEAERGETVVDLSPEIRGSEYVALVTSQTLGRVKGETAKRTEKISEEQIHRAADILDVPTKKETDFRYYVGFDIPGSTEDEVLDFIRSTVALLGATRFSIDTFHRLIHSAGKGSQTEAEGRMIKRLEEIGLELGCIFILICQSNAEAEGIDNLKKNVHGVLRGSREVRDVPAAIYLIHRNQRSQKDDANPSDILELETGVFAKKTRFKGPGFPQVKLLLKEEWSLFVPLAGADQQGPPPESWQAPQEEPY